MSKRPSRVTAITVVFLNFALFGAAQQLPGSSMELLRRHFNTDAATIGTLVSAYSLGRIAVLLFTGRLLSRVSAKNALFAALALPLPLLFATPQTGGFTLALIVTFLCGIGHGLSDSSGMRTLFLASPKRYASLLGMGQFAFSFGSMLAPLAISAIAANGLHFGILFTALGVYALAMLIVTRFVKFPENPPAERETGGAKTPGGKVFIDFALLAAIMVFYNVFSGVFLTYIGSFSVEFTGLALEAGVSLITAYTVGGAAFSVFYTVILRKRHPSQVMAVNIAAAIVFAAAGFIAPSFALKLAFFFITGGVVSITFSLVMALVGEYFPRSASLPSAAIMASAVTSALTPVIVRAALGYADLRAVMLAGYLALFAEAAAIAVLFIRRRRSRAGRANIKYAD